MVAALLVAGAALTPIALFFMRQTLPRRRNFKGRHIPTAAGAAFIPIILTTLVLAATGALEVGVEGGMYLAYSLLAGGVGFADDVWSGAAERGFRGHLGALWQGRITTGLVKVLALGGGALVYGVALFGPGFDALLAAVLLAGSANLANLLDVRPGRALKFCGLPVVALLPFVPPEAAVAAAGVVGGAAGLFYFDLKGRIMLGDAGAAIWGSALGHLLVAGGPVATWWVALAAILGLTAVAEVSSISRVIQEVSLLRRLDTWGRDDD